MSARKPKRADPDIADMRAEGASLQRQARSTRDKAKYADGQAHFRDLDRARQDEAEARRMFARAAELTKQRKGELDLIHVGVSEIAMDEDSYRALVRRITKERTDSAGDCRAGERRAIIEELKSKGFKPKRKPGRRDPTQADKIRALWAELHAVGAVKDSSIAALRRWIKRQTGGRKQSPEFLSVREAQPCIEALKAWLARAKTKEELSE